MGILILALVTFIFTRNLVTSTLITFFHHFVFIFIYYFHERGWLLVKNKTVLKYKQWLRPFTYEIILGHLVLGVISWVFTGSWVAVTLITIIYIENKLWIFILYDWLWGKVTWGCKKGVIE